MNISHHLNDRLIHELKNQISKGAFGGIQLQQAMQFLLTDGVIPESGLSVQSFVDLHSWVQNFVKKPGIVKISATELKNKTGQALELAISGVEVQIVRHGRVVAALKSSDD